jgi:hypothetical protein
MMPPYLFDMRITEQGKRPIRLWLPVFLLWPLGLVFLALAFVITIVLDVLLLVFGQRYHHYTRFLVGSLDLLSQTRGTTVYVRSSTKTTVDLTVR